LKLVYDFFFLTQSTLNFVLYNLEFLLVLGFGHFYLGRH
jgi:hypothetical protein